MSLVSNKNAYRNYEIIDTYEAGIVLTGTEVKSLSRSQSSINESYINVSKGEIYIINMYIAPFEQGNIFNVDSNRTRKLLMHKKQIIKLGFESQKSGLTIIPIKLYWLNGKIKLLIGLARGKKNYDKREDLKKKELSRQTFKY